MKVEGLLLFLAALPVVASAAGAEDPPPRLAWTATGPLLAPDDRPADPCVSVKDPSVVFHKDRWHVYATVRCRSGVAMEYLSFPDWGKTAQATRRPVRLVDTYHCAPQVFYFRPKKSWFLVYQWADREHDAFGPAYSTLEDVDRPDTLTRPRMMFPRKPDGVGGWLDFWVIADDRRAHLFFTTLDGRMWRADTALADFPHGWGEPRVVLRGDIFEASHTYRLKGRPDFLTIVEAQGPGGSRYYKVYRADRLDGPWRPLADTLDRPFAAAGNVRFAPGGLAWTDSVSHGELIRDGVDETMTVDPARLRFLFQGCSAADRAGKDYGRFPWRLGLLEAAAPLP